AGLDRGELARSMVGEAPAPLSPMPESTGPVRLEVSGLCARSVAGGPGIEDISLTVRAGEIQGIAGVGGNGQPVLAAALTGLARPSGGTVRINGEEISDGVAVRRELGLRAIPDDRFRSGLFADLSAYENYGITGLAAGAYGGWLGVARRPMRSAT